MPKEVKIKNVTVTIDDQDYSFSAKSVVANVEYDATKDPEVQGPGVADIPVTIAAPIDAATTTEGATQSTDADSESTEVEVTSQPTE